MKKINWTLEKLKTFAIGMTMSNKWEKKAMDKYLQPIMR